MLHLQVVSGRSDLYLQRRKVELEQVLVDYWGVMPKNIVLQVTETLTKLLILGDGVEIVSSTEPEHDWIKIFRDFNLEHGAIVKKSSSMRFLYFKLTETSVGTTVMVAKKWLTDPSSTPYAQIDAVGGNIYLYEALPAIRYNRFFKTEDEIIRSRLMALNVPNLSSQSKLDPVYYKLMMNEYEFLARDVHDVIVAHLLPKLRGEIIVPADGLGRWAKAWAGVGIFTDPVRTEMTHPRVQQKNLTDTLSLVKSGQTLILMYCTAFMTQSDWKLIYHYVSTEALKVLVIDTRVDHAFYGRQVNNMVWEIGFPELILPAFPHDTMFPTYGVKFSSTLLSLYNPVFLSESPFKDYYRFMRPFAKPEGEPTTVFATLREMLDNRDTEGQTYAAFAGIIDPIVQEWSPVKPMFVRTVYYMKMSNKIILPKNVIQEVQGKEVYFVYCEAETTKLRFEGRTKDMEISAMDFIFKANDHYVLEGWEPEDIERMLFPSRNMVRYKFDELCALAKKYGYQGTDDDLRSYFDNSQRVEKVDDYYERKKYKRRPITPLLNLSNVPEFHQWAKETYPDLPEAQILDIGLEVEYDRDKFEDALQSYSPEDERNDY
jgi:hypothetical protein